MNQGMQWFNQVRECYNKKNPPKELVTMCNSCSGYDKYCRQYTSLEKEILYRR